MSRQHSTTTSAPLLAVILGVFVAALLLGAPMPTMARQRSRPNNRPQERPVGQGGLCVKEVDMKLACHCTNDEQTRVTVVVADCLVLAEDFPQSDHAWQAFEYHPKLRHLTLTVHRNGYMSYLPSVLKHQTELRTVTITYADIHELPQFAFGNHTRLENITLAHNQIEVLDAHAFANHVSLQLLNLEDNQIVQLDAKAFGNLPELQELVLTRNNISVLHEDMFERMGKLVRLRMSENLVVDLSRDVFKGLGNLRVLDMSFNNLRFLRDTVFAELWSMQELDLESNAIERLSERAFDGLNNLRYLNMRQNKLKALEGGVFTGVPALTWLDITANMLESMTYDNVLPLMDNLVNNTHSRLDISENKLICDCRLSWMYELRSRTKNPGIRRTIDQIACTMIRPTPPRHELSAPLDDLHFRLPNEMGNYPIISYDAHGNVMKNQIYLQQRLQPNPAQHLDDRDTDIADERADGKATSHDDDVLGEHTRLMLLDVDHLPCPRAQAAEPTELPLPRESIGLDLSWLSAGVGTGGSSNTNAACMGPVPGLSAAAGSVLLAIAMCRLRITMEQWT